MSVAATQVEKKTSTSSSSSSLSRETIKSPVSPGLGGMPTTIAPGSNCEEGKRLTTPLQEGAKKVKLEETKSTEHEVTAHIAQLPPLPPISEDQKTAVVKTYELLAKGSFAQVITLPQFSWWTSLKWFSFDWMQLKRDIDQIQKHSPTLKLVHPLRFLLVVKQESGLKENLKIVRSQVSGWDERMGSIQNAVSKLGVTTDMSAAWTQTIKDFSADMQTKISNGSLCLETFLAEFPEEERPEFKSLIDTQQFEGVFNKVLG